MLCITGRESNLAQLAQRLDTTGDAMHEVRLDMLDRVDDGLFDLLARHAPQLLVCCRPERQGGAYTGDEATRLSWLQKAQARGVRWLDLEADVEDAALQPFEPQRLLLSWHDMGGIPADLSERAASLAGRTNTFKVAVQVDDSADLETLHALSARYPNNIWIGMGAAGVLSRARYAAFGSPWCYVADRGSQCTAPGQLHRATAALLGLPGNAAAPWCGLLSAVAAPASPGFPVYNQLYRDHDWPLSYVPLISRQPERLLRWLPKIGIRGLSVTQPHKRVALAVALGDRDCEEAGAANSLRPTDTGGRTAWLARNSDIVGVQQPLQHALRATGVEPLARALILGAGGAARAAVIACRRLGLPISLCARRPQQAQAIASSGDRIVPWSQRAEAAHDVLLNATSLGGGDDPWPAETDVRARVVFDMTLQPHGSLLRRAHAAGAQCVDGRSMWLAQAAEQMSWFLEREIEPHMLAALLPAAAADRV